MLAAVGAAMLLVGCNGSPAEVRQTEYAVTEVETRDVTFIDKYPATIKGRQDVEIFPQVSGRITDIKVKEGQRVRRGQTLFVIDQVPYRAALQTASANESAAKAGVATARLNYEGKKELWEKRVTSEFEMLKAKNALLSAEAALEQAKAQVTDARNNLSYTTVTSPCDGVVGTLPYRIGALVSVAIAQPFTTVSDNSEMYVYFSVPENQMLAWVRSHGSVEKAISAMPSAILYLNDGKLYAHEGRVEAVSGVIDQLTGSVSLRAVFANPEGMLHSGGAGNLGIKTERRGALVIPQSATYEVRDKVFAYRLLHGKAVATRIDATAGADKKIYIVSSGLEAGDVIVAEGVSMLKDGTSIKARKGGTKQ